MKKSKLTSLSAFQQQSINQLEMAKFKGGVVAPGTSQGGTTCVPGWVSASGCVSYTSDSYDSTTGSTTYYNISDVNLPC